ncbi:MAG TPA: hypothetical protein VE971_01425 [Candidatus Eisenbacteria bacterium]|nr:hypothetical protein [Candidatus Eisenbacteria bacterium]
MKSLSPYRGYSESNINDENIVDQLKASWEVRSFLLACEAIIGSPLIRQESRGAHYRSVFPKLDEQKWKVNIFCKREEDEMITSKEKFKEIKGPLLDFLNTHIKAEHQREFE